MATHCFTQGDIFVEYGLRLAQQGRFDRRDRLGAQGSEFALHPVDSPKKIDRCRPCRGQFIADRHQRLDERIVISGADGLGSQRHSHGGSHPNRRRAAHF